MADILYKFLVIVGTGFIAVGCAENIADKPTEQPIPMVAIADLPDIDPPFDGFAVSSSSIR